MATKKQPQLDFFNKGTSRYGGSLQTTRKGRAYGRPVSTKHSMHFVLRSTKARGEWSFLRHKKAIAEILKRFADKNGVKIESFANVGNHLHLHLKLANRHAYKPFIRAITSAIMMRVTGASRWKQYSECASQLVRHNENTSRQARSVRSGRFWDRRPFSRIVVSFKAALNLRDYILINKFEGFNYDRGEATFLMRLNTGQLNTS
jgi:REP element-mobilizing transposase RayT